MRVKREQLQKDLEASNLAFFYGTLKRGFENHHLLRKNGFEYFCDAETAERYPMLMHTFPCLLDESGNGHFVRGEIFRIPDIKSLRSLDEFEGHPEHYYRKLIELADSSSLSIVAWTYFYPRRAIPGDVASYVAEYTVELEPTQ